MRPAVRSMALWRALGAGVYGGFAAAILFKFGLEPWTVVLALVLTCEAGTCAYIAARLW